MPVRVYSKEQLLALRNSPLVCKPENLPAIEAWIEYVSVEIDGERQRLRIPHSESQQQSQSQRQDGARRAQPRMPTGGEALPMGSFSAGSRPALMSMRSHVSRSGDKTNEANHAEDTEATRHSRGFGEKQTNRKSLNANETETRHSRDAWTQARDRRAQGGDEETGERRFGRREREQEGERRNGYGEKTDGRWGAHREEKRPNGDRTGGWRERERERQKPDRDRDRDWERSGKDPEWMEDPVNKQDDDDLSTMGMPKNQEDFEKWKQAQHARTKRPTNDTALEASDAPPSAPLQVTAPANKIEPLKLDSLADKAFGDWGENRRAEPTTEGLQPTVPIQPPAKGKSRFMPMFQKDKPREQVPAVEIPQASKGSEDDNKAGFDRILQMLSTTGMSQAATPVELPSRQPPIPREPVSPLPLSQSTANGQRPKSRFTGFFDQTPKSPDRLQSPHATESQSVSGPRDDGIHSESHHFARDSRTNFGLGSPDEFVRQRMDINAAQGLKLSSDPPPSDRQKEQPPQQARIQDLFLEPPSRATSTPDNNIQNLLAQRNKGQQGQDKNSDFLLSLLQAKGSARPTSSQAHPDFPLWIDQAKVINPEPHAPRSTVHAKAGILEDQVLRHGPFEMPRQDQQQASAYDINQRRTAQRAPPGFFDEQTLFLQQQQQQQGQPPRRPFPEPPQHQGPPSARRAPGFPGHQMQMPQSAPQYLPQDYLQSAPGLHAGPPPGFNPHMRHPPGFHNIPNIFEAPQPQQQKLRQPVPPPPPNFGGAMIMPGQGPPLSNVPPGFFAGPPVMPPGFMPMRQPEGLSATVRGSGRGAHDGFDTGGQRR